MSDQKLARQYIEFMSKGLDRVQADMGAIKAGLESVAVRVAAAKAGFQAMTGSIQGWIRAGMQGTAVGNYLTIQMQYLSREIASVFLPTIRMVIQAVTSMVQWFRNLSGDQQNFIRRMVEAAAAMVLVSAILPRLIGGVIALASAIGVGSGGLVPLLGFVVTAMAGIAVGTEGGRTALGRFAESIRPLLSMLATLGRTIGDAFGQFAESALPAVIGLFNALVPAVVAVVGAVVQAGQAIGEAFGPALRAIMASIEPMIRAVVPVVVRVIGFIGQLGVAIGRVLGPVIERIMPVLVAVFGAVMQIVDRLVQFLTRLAPIFERIFAIVVRIAEVIGSILFRAIQMVGRVFGEEIATWEDAFNLIVRAVDRVVEAMERAADIIGGIVEGIQTAADAAADIANSSNGGGIMGWAARWFSGGGMTNINGGTVGQASQSGGTWNEREDIGLAGGKTTSAEQHYRELQSNVLAASIPQQQLETAQESRDLLQEMLDWLRENGFGWGAGGGGGGAAEEWT